MNIRNIPRSLVGHVRRRPVLFGVIAAALALSLLTLIATSKPANAIANYYEVRRGDFLISVVEGGNIEAVNEVVIRNEVEGTARIIYIVPEGSYVKKGDLLVELDSSSSQDAVNQQQIAVEKAQFAVLQAQQQLEIEKSSVDSAIDAAELKVEFAESDLNKYLEGEWLQLLRNAQIEATNVLETLRIAEERLEWTEKLYDQGYETKANLDKDRLAVSQNKLRLEQAEKALWILEKFDHPKKKRELEAALQAAQEDLERVKLQSERRLAQFQADVETQQKTLELSIAKLERDKRQLQATKIYAPQDGLVVYASGGGRFSNESMIEEGAVVRNRQEIIKLPDVSEMKLTVKIHESHVNQIRPGQQAFIVLDSMPDQRFRGAVTKVAPLPDSQSRWSNPNLKVYPTEIRILERLPDVKPGVSARAEVVVTNLANVMTVPIQAVTTLKGRPVAYLAGDQPRPVPVSVGMYNNKFIEVTSGLNPGDRVLLSPPFDTQEKDLAGEIVAKDEPLPPAPTNHVTPTLAQAPPITRSADRPNPALPGIAEMIPGTPDEEGGGARQPRSRRRDGDSEQRPDRGNFPPGTASSEEGERPRRPGFQRDGNRPNREEMLRQFDQNGDGQLDEQERAAMRERFGGRQRNRGGNNPASGGSEAPASGPGQPSVD